MGTVKSWVWVRPSSDSTMITDWLPGLAQAEEPSPSPLSWKLKTTGKFLDYHADRREWT